jgi:hypothetical protein
MLRRIVGMGAVLAAAQRAAAAGVDVEFASSCGAPSPPDYHWTIHRSYGTYKLLVELIINERDKNKEA